MVDQQAVLGKVTTAVVAVAASVVVAVSVTEEDAAEEVEEVVTAAVGDTAEIKEWEKVVFKRNTSKWVKDHVIMEINVKKEIHALSCIQIKWELQEECLKLLHIKQEAFNHQLVVVIVMTLKITNNVKE